LGGGEQDDDNWYPAKVGTGGETDGPMPEDPEAFLSGEPLNPANLRVDNDAMKKAGPGGLS